MSDPRSDEVGTPLPPGQGWEPQATPSQEGDVRDAPAGEDDEPTDGEEPLNPA